MPRTAFAAFILVAGVSAAFAATDDELREQIVGSWGENAACPGASLTFNADSTFALAQQGRSETGTWQIAGGILSGATADGSSRPDIAVRIEDDQLHFVNAGQTVEQLTRCAS